jgi:hypothetical protein
MRSEAIRALKATWGRLAPRNVSWSAPSTSAVTSLHEAGQVDRDRPESSDVKAWELPEVSDHTEEPAEPASLCAGPPPATVVLD